ncbi:hypothetical protein GCM10023185_17240 [Hymenobacter saemangeumensis]|uniref:Uncharacterized protein n=2 Tax=Hymenobacter saemangeumensis TaxID=1084522 RepID=A0ABP8IAY7_9BACT
MTSQGPKKPLKAKQAPRLYTLREYHEECTECGDFQIDSGKVIIPLHMRETFINQALKSRRMRGRSKEEIADFYKSRGYTAGLRLESEEAFDSLFLLPGHSRGDTLKNKYGVVYPWDFERQYRVTGMVTGMQWPYLQFKVIKAVLLLDPRKY